jgi:hypothetical protein
MPAQGRRRTIAVNLLQDSFRANGNAGRLNFDRHTIAIPPFLARQPVADQFPGNVFFCRNLAE